MFGNNLLIVLQGLMKTQPDLIGPVLTIDEFNSRV